MPNWNQEIRNRLAGLELEPWREAAIIEELSQDLDECYAEKIAMGRPPVEAARLTLAELSERPLLSRELRKIENQITQEPIVLGTHRRRSMIADLWYDLRYSARMFIKNPGFALIVAATLSLGIGANTMLFSFVNALLLRPLAGVAEPERLVHVGRQYKDKSSMSDSSYPDYLDYRDQNTVMSGLALRAPAAFHFSAGREAERVDGEWISENYFDVLGVSPVLGRLITPADASNPSVAMISYGLWRRRFGSDPNIIGNSIKLDGFDYAVVGVTGPGFEGLQIGQKTGVWVPLVNLRRIDPARAGILDERRPSWLELFGRLKDGATLDQARAEFTGLNARLAPQTNSRAGVRLEPGVGLDPGVRAEARRFVYIPFAAFAVVLLIACANVAGLLLARAASRRKEIAVRLALGASRGRIVRQLMTESLTLALAGGAMGLALGVWLTGWLRNLLPEKFLFLPLDLDFGMDWRVFVFTLAVSAATGLLFGLIPALQGSTLDLTMALKETRAGGMARARLRSALIVTQVALTVTLLVAAGLCIRTLRNAQAIDLGYKLEHQLTARIELPRKSYSKEQGERFQRQLLERVQALPGVEAAGFAVTMPLNDGRWETGVVPEGKDKRMQSFQNFITPRYLETMQIPLMAGRSFSDHDDANAPQVVIINETLARNAWPNESPLGKRLTWKGGPKEEFSAEVVGVARDAKGRNLFEAGGPMFYLPLFQHYQSGTILHIRSGVEPLRLAEAVRREVSALDPGLPLYAVKPLGEHLAATLTPQRLLANLISAVGLVALLLSAAGLYGLLSYTVAQRTPEIGVRMALGAQDHDVQRLVVMDGMRLALAGLALGLVFAFGLTRLIKGLLYGVSPTDPVTFAGIALLLLGTALIACYLPARSATKVDPLVALRTE
jgi:predicted permease